MAHNRPPLPMGILAWFSGSVANTGQTTFEKQYNFAENVIEYATVRLGTELMNLEQIGYKLIFTSYDSFLHVVCSPQTLPPSGKIFYKQKSKMAATNTITHNKVPSKCKKYGM